MSYFAKKKLILPDGFYVNSTEIPPARLINNLLVSAGSDFFSNDKLYQAIKNSNFFFAICNESKRQVFGFVRVTSDKGLNANYGICVHNLGRIKNFFIQFY